MQFFNAVDNFIYSIGSLVDLVPVVSLIQVILRMIFICPRGPFTPVDL